MFTGASAAEVDYRVQDCEERQLYFFTTSVGMALMNR